MFQSSKFTFNDIESCDMGVILVTLETDILLKHSLNYEVSPMIDIPQNSAEGYLYGVKFEQPEPIELTMALVDKIGNSKRWTTKERLKIFEWLNQEDYKPFVSEDDDEIVYYLKCIGIRKELNANLEGLVTFVMQPSSPYAYSPIINFNYCNLLNSSHSMKIKNISNIDKYYFPKIKIINYDSNGKIEIFNNSTKTSFTIENLEYEEELLIDMNMKHIESSIGINRLKDSNMNWIGLCKGDNILILNGKADFNIQCQFPLLV